MESSPGRSRRIYSTPLPGSVRHFATIITPHGHSSCSIMVIKYNDDDLCERCQALLMAVKCDN